MERSTMGWAAQDASEILSPYTYTLRNTGAEDIFLKALYCGVCHTDIHKTRGQGNHVTSYPMVSGHEVVGEVMEVGADATKFIVGDHVGVGYFVGSCERRSIVGSLTGRVKETEELLEFWKEKGLSSMIEIIKMDYINTAIHRLEQADVRYRVQIVTLRNGDCGIYQAFQQLINM